MKKSNVQKLLTPLCSNVQRHSQHRVTAHLESNISSSPSPVASIETGSECRAWHSNSIEISYESRLISSILM